MCKSALQNVQPYQKRKLCLWTLQELVVCGYQLGAGSEASEKSGKERFRDGAWNQIYHKPSGSLGAGLCGRADAFQSEPSLLPDLCVGGPVGHLQ